MTAVREVINTKTYSMPGAIGTYPERCVGRDEDGICKTYFGVPFDPYPEDFPCWCPTVGSNGGDEPGVIYLPGGTGKPISPNPDTGTWFVSSRRCV